ncbi:odorant receptor 67b [Melitaea cinxia]|uniref:odorant receptor 67b n=1 Tax=Melitaea cinxia TaxID=113334 RepID=UPI001E2728C1|nr:odorant receptor 67b [Melitaea cinxia]
MDSKNEIKDTVNDFLKCDSRVIPHSRFAKNLRKNLRVVKKRASLIWITFATNGLIYLILPLATPGRHFTIELFILYGLDPMFESPNYEIATVIFTISSGFAVYSMVGIAVYVLLMVGYNEALMYTLSEELKNVWNDSRKFYNRNKHIISDKRQAIVMKEQIMNEFIRIRLKDIVRFHITNINLLRELNRELRPLLALEYTLLVVAIISELLGGLEHTYLALPYTIVQMLMDCLAGQRMIDASDDFERSVYCCQWENFNVMNQKTVFLMLMMSQKTLILSAGGFATLNYQFLMAILKTSYSTYTTLRSTVN